MILVDMFTHEDENNELLLTLKFTEGTLSFQCPIGFSASDTIGAFKAFIVTAEDLLNTNMTLH